jgi:predicted alpha/beta hydrolase family esterase
MQFVIVPGIDNSDEQHWQSIWEAEWVPRCFTYCSCFVDLT